MQSHQLNKLGTDFNHQIIEFLDPLSLVSFALCSRINLQDIKSYFKCNNETLYLFIQMTLIKSKIAQTKQALNALKDECKNEITRLKTQEKEKSLLKVVWEKRKTFLCGTLPGFALTGPGSYLANVANTLWDRASSIDLGQLASAGCVTDPTKYNFCSFESSNECLKLCYQYVSDETNYSNEIAKAASLICCGVVTSLISGVALAYWRGKYKYKFDKMVDSMVFEDQACFIQSKPTYLLVKSELANNELKDATLKTVVHKLDAKLTKLSDHHSKLTSALQIILTVDPNSLVSCGLFRKAVKTAAVSANARELLLTKPKKTATQSVTVESKEEAACAVHIIDIHNGR